MCYEAAIASFGGDDMSLAKSFIISLKSTTTNWYAHYSQGQSHLGPN
jgi:hypothetical protein